MLRREFYGDSSLFLVPLCVGSGWNESAYYEMVDAMTACCRERQSRAPDSVERWVAGGFWDAEQQMAAWYDREQTGYPRSRKYYEERWQMVWHLCFWLFMDADRPDNWAPEYAVLE